ncbi:MAG: hypothetical protein NUV69_02920 [Candidatus Curtissbacteria bacterium]|nr:hypothetical protein [Candidatus Curtissbacteria bacterium]
MSAERKTSQTLPVLHALVPGEILVQSRDDVSHVDNLKQDAQNYLDGQPGILDHAKEKGKDIIARTSSHGKVILIGVGVAAFAGTAGAILIYRHEHDKSVET